MITFNPNINTTASSNRVQKQNFGSFPVPRHCGEAQDLLDRVGFGLMEKTPDNVESLRIAFKTGKQVSGVTWRGVEAFLVELAEKWKLDPNELRK